MIYSYIMGMAWYIICNQARELSDNAEDIRVNFFTDNGLHVADGSGYRTDGRPYIEQTIIALYFGLTTLSTVGLGDYHPLTDFERALCCVCLFGGVLTMSFVVGVFLDGVDKILIARKDIEEYDELEKFFVLMKKYNRG